MEFLCDITELIIEMCFQETKTKKCPVILRHPFML